MKTKQIPLLAITAIITLTACKKESQTPPQQYKYLDFQTQLEQTKGAAKSEFVIGDQFFVYGITTQSDNYNIDTPNANGYIFSQEVAKGVPVMNYGKDNTGNDVWKYNNPIVWSPGKSTFFAFSPVPNHSQNFGISNHANGFDLTAIPSINFTVAGGYNAATATKDDIVASRAHNRKQVDLLFAYTPDQVSGKPTTLLFEHALAQITFAIKPMQTVGFLRINSVTLQNVMTTCKLNLAHAGDPTAIDFTGGWQQATLSNLKAFSINLRHDVASLIPATPNVIYELNDADETLMMIPQTLENIVLNINFAYSQDGKTWPDYNDGKQINVPLSKISSHWKPSKQYRYLLAITPNSDTGFDAGIEDLDPEIEIPID